jgi:hypothetical protein
LTRSIAIVGPGRALSRVILGLTAAGRAEIDVLTSPTLAQAATHNGPRDAYRAAIAPDKAFFSSTHRQRRRALGGRP